MNDKVAGIETSEIIRGGAKQLKEAAFPTGIRKEKDTGEVKFEEARQPGKILERAELNQALTPDDVSAHLRGTRQELNVLERIPESVKFSLEPGEPGQRKRKEQLKEILKKIGVKDVEVEGISYTADEVWDAVCYEGRQAHNFSGKKDEATDLLGDDRGEKIKKHAKEILTETGKENAENILNIATTLVVEDVDPLSLREKDLRKPFKKTLFAVHGKQKIPNVAKATVRDVIVVKKHLERWQVVNTFLNQQAEGRTGQEKEAEPGDPQLPYQLGFDEKRKRIVIAHVPDEEMDEIVKVLRATDHMVKTAQEQILQGVQGYGSWVAEAVVRRAHEIWSETSKSIQKDLGGMMTHLSEVGHGHFIAAALEIPEVGKILARPDWYQPRDPLTDRPKEMPSVIEIVKNVKRWAKLQDIPSSKVDLAFFLTQLLQTGHWIGRIGLKHRNILERYGLEELATGLPIGGFDKVPQVVDGVVKNAPIEEMRRDERINFELQVRDFAETVAGTCLDWSAESLGRLVDGALQEDILYRMNVGEPPLYAPPEEIDERIVAVIHEKQMLFEGDSGLKKTKELLEESYLHREQYRWLFVWAKFGGLYSEWKGKTGVKGNWERRLGKQSAEKQYLNPGKQEDHQALIDWLQNKDFARDNLARAGINPDWITDEVIQRLFTDENMLRVNDFREGIFARENRKVQLSDVRATVAELVKEDVLGKVSPEEATRTLAMALEFVLRDKRTWNVDMGVNNSRFSDPNLSLAREVRQKSEFGANEAHILVTMEDSRQNIHDTFRKILGNMSLIHLENEFPNIKKYMEEMINTYGDDSRYRSGTLTGPELAMETSLSIRAAEMIIGYYRAGYEATGGDWVASQQFLYDRFDINRILHEHFHPVVGSARRIYGIEKHEEWIDKILARQRAAVSNVVDTRWEQLFAASPQLQQILSHLIVGGSGKGMYSHCVLHKVVDEAGRPVRDEETGRWKEELLLRNDAKYWEARVEREAEQLYFPASDMVAAGWRGAALQGQMDEDKAKAEIDAQVSLGFMRRAYDDVTGEAVGLGDLFYVEFDFWDSDVAGDNKLRKRKFPINFMVDLSQQAMGLSQQYAFAEIMRERIEHPGSGRYEDLNPATFWQLGKNDQLQGDNEKLWKEFSELMEVGKEGMGPGWALNVNIPDSGMPKTYWFWREAVLGEILKLSGERLENIPEGGLGKLASRGWEWLRGVAGKENRTKLIEGLQKDPVQKELKQIKEAYGKWVVEELTRELTRANERGLFLADKVGIRRHIEEFYQKGKIEKDTRDRLLSMVIKTRYKPDWRNDIKDPNFWVNSSLLTIAGLGVDIVGGIAEMLKLDLKKQLWFDQAKVILNSSPAGYVAGTIFNPSFYAAIHSLQAAGQTIALPGILSKIPFLGTLSIPGSVAAACNE